MSRGPRRSGLARRAAAALVAGVAILAPVGVGSAGADSVRVLSWDELRPAIAEPDDPFAAMSDDEYESLLAIVKSRVLESRGFPVTEESRAERARHATRLASRGIDAEEMIAKRDALIAERTAAAQAGVAALDGTRAAVFGFLLPVGERAGPASEFLLVPWAGACSHTPAPPANQVVRVRSSRAVGVGESFDPVRVEGALRVRVEERTVYALDGALAVRSTYAIDDALIEPVTLPPPRR